MADVLFGDISPSGKLPLTFPKSLDQLPPFEDYCMENRTYRYSCQEPSYPFGFGLSYSSFAYSQLVLEKSSIKAGENLPLSVVVQNHGDRRAAEVVQVYLSDLQASTPVPHQRLVGFQRISLQPGESRSLQFTLVPEMMSFYDDEGKLTLEPGEFRLEVGGCSPGGRGLELGAPKPVCANFQVN